MNMVCTQIRVIFFVLMFTYYITVYLLMVTNFINIAYIFYSNVYVHFAIKALISQIGRPNYLLLFTLVIAYYFHGMLATTNAHFG